MYAILASSVTQAIIHSAFVVSFSDLFIALAYIYIRDLSLFNHRSLKKYHHEVKIILSI